MGLFSSLFGGGKTTTKSTQTSTTKPMGAVEPVLQQGANIMQNYLNNPASTQTYDGRRVAPLSLDTRRANQDARKSVGATEAMGFYSDILGGGAGGMNPQVQQMQDAIRRQVMAANNATFSNSGTVGGTQHQGSLAKGLADGLAQPLFAAYEADMARKMNAASALPQVDQMRINNQMQVGSIRDNHNQAKINADMAKFKEQQMAPLQGWNAIAPTALGMGQALGTQTSEGTQTSQQKTPLGQQLLGGAMALGGLFTGNPMMAMGGAQGMMGGGGSPAPWSWNAPQGSSWFGSPYLAQPGQSQSPLPWRA